MALFHHYEDPAKKANKYVSQIPGAVNPYYDPYVQAGNQAMGQLQGQYGQMMGLYDPLSQAYMQSMQDPTAVLGGITSQYQTSPYEQYEQQNAMTSMNNAMQAGGMTGTPEHQTMAAQKSSDIANKYMQDYLKAALGIRSQGMAGTANLFGKGLSGLQGLNKLGFEGSKDMASAIAQTLMNQANLSYAGTAAKNQHYGTLYGALLGDPAAAMKVGGGSGGAPAMGSGSGADASKGGSGSSGNNYADYAKMAAKVAALIMMM